MDNVKGSSLARVGIMSLPSYVPDKTLQERQAEAGLAAPIILNCNENPLGVSPQACQAIIDIADKVNRYPEGTSLLLRRKMGELLRLPPEDIIFSNGGDNILTSIGHAFLNSGEEVIIGDPTFLVYATVTEIMGGKLVSVPLKNFVFDLPAMLKAITPKTKLIIITNPNNPTGTIVRQKEIDDFMAQVPPQVVVVFDEAYREFAVDYPYPDIMKHIREEKNVLVVRTLSKMYGLAGLRVGYAYGPSYLMDVMRRVMEAYPANVVAQAAALAALDDHDFVAATTKAIMEGKQYLYRGLDELGIKYLPSAANFIFADLGRPAAPICSRLSEFGLMLRCGEVWHYPTFVRISVGTSTENEILITHLAQLLNEK